MARTRPFLPYLETGTQINTKVCDDGQRDGLALGWCPGAVFNLHTGLRQSCTPHSASQRQIRGVKNLRPQRPCVGSPPSYCLPGLCLFPLDQILLWDAVNLCQLLQIVERWWHSSCWWVSPVISSTEGPVRGLGSLQTFFTHQPSSSSGVSAQKAPHRSGEGPVGAAGSRS